ncbi:hypothetical protein MP478_09685 [Chryseobacterium sp. WG14]|uniref:hypothetical protein n=1 Tax=Chryseobacterium sp. WG14 TaxID=2926909 RepID=UPI00211DCDC9|nr:hypothetical protein [Chryseobacterium sp. WG14]MCQ9639664.1 hypothetical protein [Chryseobacterium sp. WG14]
MKHFLTIIPFILSISCKNNKEPIIEYIPSIALDTLKEQNYIAIFDDATEKKADLTQSELKIIDKNVIKAVNEYNDKIENKKYRLNLRNYFRQYYVSTDSNGEKIVRVFCFCEHMDNNDWRTEKLIVHDGGKCYFNVVINITKQYHHDLKTHGIA